MKTLILFVMMLVSISVNAAEKQLYQNFIVDQYCGSMAIHLYDDDYHRVWAKVHDNCRIEVRKFDDPDMDQVKYLCRQYSNLRAINRTKESELCEIAEKN